MTNKRKVFFLALEAASPDLLARGMNEGWLPNLAALRERSSHGAIRSLRGVGANALWPSIYTGVDPSRHGRFYHSQLQDNGYHTGDASQFGVTRNTIWEEASRAGRRVAVLDLPKAPASVELNGIQVLDWSTHYSYAAEFRTVPAALAKQLPGTYGEPEECPCLDRRYLTSAPPAAAEIIDQLERTIIATQNHLVGQLRTQSWDFCMASLGALHCAGHQLWHLHDPSHPWFRQVEQAQGDPLLQVYRTIDHACGAIIDELPEDTAVVILAGPGMGPNYVRVDLLDEILLRLEGGGASAAKGMNRALKRLWRLSPQSWRQRLSGLAHAMDGRLQASDRSRRRFFSVQTNDNVGGIRINLQGREPDGLVASDALDEACDELIARIRSLHVVGSGESLVRDIFRTNTVYAGQYLAQLPDILIEWNQPGVITAITSAHTGLIRQDRLPDLSGTHNDRLWCLIHLPGEQAGELAADAGALDIAPTLAALCGLDELDLPGQPLVPLS